MNEITKKKLKLMDILINNFELEDDDDLNSLRYIYISSKLPNVLTSDELSLLKEVFSYGKSNTD